MRILIDGYYLNKPRGLGRYVQELIFALSRHAKDEIELTAVVPEDIDADLLVEPNSVEYVRRRSLPFPVWEQIFLPFFIRTRRFDVVHFPYNTKPVILNFSMQPHVVTVHDLIFLDKSAGANNYQKLGNRYRQIILGAAKYGRAAIISDTRSGAELIAKHLRCAVGYAYIPVEHFATNMASNLGSPIDGAYCLHIGGNSARKNTALCVEAFLAANPKDMKLVVIGMTDDSPLAKKYASNRVIFPSWVSDSTLAAFMANASAILFPSLAEGYGLPIVEAFSFGRPLLTSDLAPMNELAGGAAVLVNPDSLESIKDGIKEILSNAELRSTLTTLGKQRMSDVSSQQMAAKMTQIYRNLIRPL